MVGRSGHPLIDWRQPDQPSARSCLPGPATFWRIVISRLQTPVHSGAPGLRAEVMPRTSHPAVRGVDGWSVRPPPIGSRQPDRPTIGSVDGWSVRPPPIGSSRPDQPTIGPAASRRAFPVLSAFIANCILKNTNSRPPWRATPTRRGRATNVPFRGRRGSQQQSASNPLEGGEASAVRVRGPAVKENPNLPWA